MRSIAHAGILIFLVATVATAQSSTGKSMRWRAGTFDRHGIAGWRAGRPAADLVLLRDAVLPALKRFRASYFGEALPFGRRDESAESSPGVVL